MKYTVVLLMTVVVLACLHSEAQSLQYRVCDEVCDRSKCEQPNCECGSHLDHCDCCDVCYTCSGEMCHPDLGSRCAGGPCVFPDGLSEEEQLYTPGTCP
uniref:Clone 821 transcribed RNA sequence n=1 Tax=Plectreurys tristis TaxID=33319 RepID=A0A0C4W9R4_PLETR|nr:hypothetical protein [Plectreurys tristis]